MEDILTTSCLGVNKNLFIGNLFAYEAFILPEIGVIIAELLPKRLYARILLQSLTSDDRRALAVIRKWVSTDRYALSVHFSRRMAQRGLYWPDVAAVICRPRDVKPQSLDNFGRPKWIVTGHAETLGDIEIVCAIEIDESGTEFITLYWLD